MKKRTISLLLAAIMFISLCTRYSQSFAESKQVQPVENKTFEVSNNKMSTKTDASSIVYMTADISPEGLVAIYEALGANPAGDVAVKLSTGEPPNSNYLRPELIKDLVQSLDGTIVESNTAYGGQRASSAMHLQVARDHGFTDIAEFDLLDIDGSLSLPVVGGEVLTENFVGSHFTDYDYYVVLSHFKGHAMAGYGGAIKNISIGIASPKGKCWIHTGGVSENSPWGGDQTKFLKSMAEAGKSVVDSLNGNILYINVMNNLSVDCDCNGNPSRPDMHDIGILASFDPVALDRACIDLVEVDPNGRALMNRINAQNGLLTLEHGEEIGLGSRNYDLVDIDTATSTAYTVTYEANGGTGTAPAEADKVAGAEFTVKNNTFTAPSGKQFSGWNTSANGSGTSYAAGATITMPADNLTLYAQWSDITIPSTYTVTFKNGYNDITLKTETVEGGKDATPPTTPERIGYDFDGWDLPYNNITANTTVTARWKIKTYKVSFMDGTKELTTPAAQTVTYNNKAIKPAKNPTRNGHTFIGWYTSSAYTK